MNQVLLGISIPYVAGAIIYVRRRCRASLRTLILMPAFMAASALWAVAPDVPRMLGMGHLYFRLSQAPWTDIFFFHYTIDKCESDSRWYSVFFVLIILSMLLVAWRELKLAEEQTDANG